MNPQTSNHPSGHPQPLREPISRSWMLEVVGEPVPQGSKRHVGGGRMIEAHPRLKAWRATIVAAAVNAGMARLAIDAPVTVDVEFRVTAPARPRFRSAPATTADLDKLIRAVGDAMCNAGGGAQVVINDSRIVAWHARKVWAIDQPGCTITIREDTP